MGVPVAAPYWVFKLGPETYGVEGQYEYAVVSSELQVSLFVLTRNVTTFYSTWKPEIDTYLAQNGWDKVRIPARWAIASFTPSSWLALTCVQPWNSPINITQIGCTYW